MQITIKEDSLHFADKIYSKGDRFDLPITSKAGNHATVQKWHIDENGDLILSLHFFICKTIEININQLYSALGVFNLVMNNEMNSNNSQA